MDDGNAGSLPPVRVTLEVQCLSGIQLPGSEDTVQSVQIEVRDGETLRLGRSRSNDLVLVNHDVSRFHATIQASTDAVLLSDLSSSNGTFVNGRLVSAPTKLTMGDTVTMGLARIKVSRLNIATAPELLASATHLAQMSSVELTVLLVDVCSYTKISQALPPGDVAEMLRRWFELVNPIIIAAGGTIDKYIGDCVMAFWTDVKGADRRSVAIAAETALKIVEETKRLALSGTWPFESTYPWRCRAALNTGSALMGGVAGGAKNITVLGDAVNVTFRVEGYASKLGCDLVMSSAAAGFLQGKYTLKNLGNFPLEGRTGEESIYTILPPIENGAGR